MVKVNVKWGKESYDLDIEPSAGLEVLQAELFSLTNVPAERQKLLLKGKMLKTDEDISKITEGAKLMLMGTADALAAPTVKTVFEEDLTSEQKTNLIGQLTQVGLQNLGNTCYMNSTLQALRSVKELKTSLKSYSRTPAPQQLAPYQRNNHVLATTLSQVFTQLDSANTAVIPFSFTAALRAAYPQFDQKSPQGAHMQQDAEECLNSMLSSLSSAVKEVPQLENDDTKLPADNTIDALFGGEMDEITKCTETDTEPEQKKKDKFRKLQCHIGTETNFLHDGILADLKDQMVKRSPTLGRDAVYERKRAISKLPSYLIVQFVRFFWKKDTEKKAKILRKVTFPMTLDILPYCTPELQSALSVKRAKKLDEEAIKLGLDPLSKLKVKKDTGSATPAPAPAPTPTPAPTTESTPKAEAMDVDNETKVPDLKLSHTGNYELQAVVTHQGRYAESGHYIGWVKQKPDEWLKFDDDVVTPCNDEEILKLSGGGDWHMAYLLIYRLALDSDPVPEKVSAPKK